MKCFVLISALLCSVVLAPAKTKPPKPTPAEIAAKKQAAKEASKAEAEKKVAARKAASKAKAANKGKKNAAAPPTPASFKRGQQAPTSDRYREIQQALAERGYFKDEPTGKWDSQSADALKQFQAENNLSPTGKISSLSLIELGLGPKHESSAVLPAVGDAVQLPPEPEPEPLPPAEN